MRVTSTIGLTAYHRVLKCSVFKRVRKEMTGTRQRRRGRGKGKGERENGGKKKKKKECKGIRVCLCERGQGCKGIKIEQRKDDIGRKDD